MAIAAHGHHIQLMTRFRGQVVTRALVLLAASAITWTLPPRAGAPGVDTPPLWWGSALTEVTVAAAVGVLIVIASIAYGWQRFRPADMGALAWVVAGGILGFGSVILVLISGFREGPVYWWLAVAVVVTSMTLQVIAALAGHGLAVLATRR